MKIATTALGRVVSLDFFVNISLMPISKALAGTVADAIGLRNTFFCIASIVPVVVAVVAVGVGRAARRRDRVCCAKSGPTWVVTGCRAGPYPTRTIAVMVEAWRHRVLQLGRRSNDTSATSLTAERLWPFVLALCALMAWVFNVLVFSPGFMSPDSISQLVQAESGYFSDWHPPVLALLWRTLILTTGHVGALLGLQTLVEWAALFGLALLVHRETASRGASLAVLGIGLLPFVLGISGVIWKDVHLAFALLAATVLALWLRRFASPRGLLFWLAAAAT